MTDFLGLAEATKELVEPVNKLIDAVSGAIGKIYEPTHIKRKAKAQAEEINLIAEAIRENSELPIIYNQSQNVSIDTSSYEELAKRTGNRLVFQEIKKQQNIEAVANKTHDLLKDSEKVSAEPVNQDWMTRFINSVEDISNDEMQDVWARILAGEIKKPKTFSLRTLEIIKNLTSYEANLFQKLSQFFISMNGSVFIPSNKDLLKKHGIMFAQILKLAECGLCSAQSLTLNFELAKEPDMMVKTYSNQTILLIKSGETGNQKITLGIYLLNAVGEELYKVIGTALNNRFLIDYGVSLREEHKNQIITAHERTLTTNDKIFFSSQDILPAKENSK